MATTVNSIYMPNNVQPFMTSIDMNLDNTISCQVNGNVIDSYSLVIKDTNNAIVYNSSKVMLQTKLYNLQQLNILISGGVVITKGVLKIIITYYNGTESVSSNEKLFSNITTPILSSEIGTTITSHEYLFNPVYTQAENIPIKKYNYSLYLVNYGIFCGSLNSVPTDQHIVCGTLLDTVVTGKHINCSNF